MVKALWVFGFFLLGTLLIAIALFGMSGVWDKFLFISLKGLQQSWTGFLWLVGFGVASWAFGGILLRTS